MLKDHDPGLKVTGLVGPGSLAAHIRTAKGMHGACALGAWPQAGLAAEVDHFCKFIIERRTEVKFQLVLIGELEAGGKGAADLAAKTIQWPEVFLSD